MKESDNPKNLAEAEWPGAWGSRNDRPMRLGLIGSPISHSKSPALFLKHYASRPDILEHWSYDLIERDTFDEAWAAFLQDYVAVNVTAPFKEDAFKAAGTHSYSALRCLASNLLVKSRSGVSAYNTDFEAILKILQQEFPKPEEHRAMVIGCGGAGKAATAAALEVGMKVYLCNRTVNRAQEFADYLRRYDPHKCGTVSKILNLNGYVSISTTEAANIQWTIPPALKIAIYEADTIIYTLPEPSDNLRRFLSDDHGLLAGKTVIEANYKSPVLSFTPCRHYISGLTWLRLQALATYRIVIGR